LNIDYDTVYNFFINHLFISASLIIILAVFLWKKPKEFSKFTLLILVVTVLLYFFSFLNNSIFTGYKNKQDMTKEKQINY